MYGLPSAWAAYYEETEPKKRRALLQEALAAEDDGANTLRRELFDERYDFRREPERDEFLLQYLFLPNRYSTRNGLFSGFDKDVGKLLAAFHLDGANTLGEAERGALYWEFRNTAKRYLETCRSERYGKKLMGLVSPTPEEKLAKTAEDIWAMSRGVARAAGREAEMQLFCDALYDELRLFDERCAELYQNMDASRAP
ncbi:MAG: hypothetical protein IJV43_03925 [Oscillospiraceae bacterium]|nr:hypothetical protein [Oscillospiraceae bacterium]